MKFHTFFTRISLLFVMSCTIMQAKIMADPVQDFLKSVPQKTNLNPNQSISAEQQLYSPLDDMAAITEKPQQTNVNINNASLPGKKAPLSKIELYYKERLGFNLPQFGYDHFSGQENAQKPTGSVSSAYAIGLDDEFIISFRGQNNTTYRTRVDRHGNLVIPGFSPISAAGLTFGEMKKSLEEKTKEQFVETEVYVTIGALRSVSVFVAGEVTNPGKIQLTNLSTALDALIASGGIKKTGSLRHIVLKRGETTQKIDLYDLFLSVGSGEDTLVQDGDRIIVPPLNTSIALTDEVGRPGIYELAGTDEALNDVLTYAGEPLRPSGNRFVLIHPDQRGIERVTEHTNITNVHVHANAIVRVMPTFNAQKGAIYLAGHTRQGIHALKKAPTLKHLLKGREIFNTDAYTLFGAIERTDPQTLASSFVAVNFSAVLNGKENHKLQDNDRVIVLSQNDVRYLVSKDIQEILAGKTSSVFDESKKADVSTKKLENTENNADTGALLKEDAADDLAIAKNNEGLKELVYVISGARLGRFANAILGASDQEKGAVANQMPCPDIYNEFPKLLPFVLDHTVSLRGEVGRPGAYPITAKTHLNELFNIASGFSREADKQNIEVSRFYWDNQTERGAVKRHMICAPDNKETLYPGDVVRVSAVYTDRDEGPVLLAGEFIKPGWYDIKKGEKYSEIIARAGGLADFAYPYGAIFTRDRIKNAEEQANARLAREIQANMATAMLEKDNAGGATEALKLLIDDLKNQPVIGRIIAESDPAILQTKPDLDMLMEPYDRIYMPKRPKQVMVMGEVLNPSTLQFESGLDIRGYIKKTGGYSRGADRGQTFVVLPNGEARSMSTAFWRFSDLHIPPGSTIIVPKDVKPFSFLTLAKDITPVLSNLAVSAASLSVISNRK